MVEFSRYVEIGYEVAREKGAELSGPGTQEANREFMSMLSEAYNQNDHSEASEQAARRFLREEITVN
jgi:hypothetical protein